MLFSLFNKAILANFYVQKLLYLIFLPSNYFIITIKYITLISEKESFSSKVFCHKKFANKKEGLKYASECE